jgi:hypothetical protein
VRPIDPSRRCPLAIVGKLASRTARSASKANLGRGRSLSVREASTAHPRNVSAGDVSRIAERFHNVTG